MVTRILYENLILTKCFKVQNVGQKAKIGTNYVGFKDSEWGKTDGRRVFFVRKIKDGVEQRRAKQTNDNISDSEQCLRTFMQNISKDINKSINYLNRRIKQMEDIF